MWCGDLRANSAEFKWRGERLDGARNILGTLGWRLLVLRAIWQSGDWEYRQAHLSLRKLSTSFALSNSTDPLDCIYGLLGLAEDIQTSDDQIIPEYTKSTAKLLLDVIRNQFGWASAMLNVESAPDYIHIPSRTHPEVLRHSNSGFEEVDTINEKHKTEEAILRNSVLGTQAQDFPTLQETQCPLNASQYTINPDEEEDEIGILAITKSAIVLQDQKFRDQDFISH
jgi:hypothetical protein